MKLEIRVLADIDETTGKAVVSIGYPKEQEKMHVKEATHLLIAGASLLIKACSKVDVGIKDHELIKEVYEHLSKEFTSTESYEDAFIRKDSFLVRKCKYCGMTDGIHKSDCSFMTKL